MRALRKYNINGDKYLDVILCLKDKLPRDIIYIVTYIYINLFRDHYLYGIPGGLILQTKNKVYHWNNRRYKLHTVLEILKDINLSDIKNIYDIPYDAYNTDYIVVETLKYVYMIFDNKLLRFKVENIIMVSVAHTHNMILTKDAVLSTGMNHCGELGCHETGIMCYLRNININNVNSILCGPYYTFFLCNNQLFFCGKYGNNTFWTPHQINTSKIIREIYMSNLLHLHGLETFQFITDYGIYEVSNVVEDLTLNYSAVNHVNIKFNDIVKTIYGLGYILRLVKEDSKNVLYIQNTSRYGLNIISRRYNLSKYGSQKLPIDDIIDISRAIVLTKSRLYIFDHILIQTIFSNIIQENLYVNLCDLDNEIDYEGRIIESSIITKFYRSLTSNSYTFELF